MPAAPILFATLDRPNLQPRPAQPYAFARWKRARVAPDDHVEVDSCRYSVPFGPIRQEVDIGVCGAIVEIFHCGTRVASHPHCPGRRSHVTLPEHMPSAHRRHAEWTPPRMLTAAERLDAACRRGLTIRARSVAGVRSILKTGLDWAFLEEGPDGLPLHHANIRGQGYHH